MLSAIKCGYEFRLCDFQESALWCQTEFRLKLGVDPALIFKHVSSPLKICELLYI